MLRLGWFTQSYETWDLYSGVYDQNSQFMVATMTSHIIKHKSKVMIANARVKNIIWVNEPNLNVHIMCDNSFIKLNT